MKKQGKKAKSLDKCYTEIGILEHREHWSYYPLSDGNTLRIRPLILEVHDTGQINQEGDPIYNVISTVFVSVVKKL